MFNIFRKSGKPKPPEKIDLQTVLPRIKHLNFLTSTKALLAQVAKEGQMVEGQMPLTRPLAGDLIVSYAFDKGDNYESFRVADAQALGLTAAEVDRLAIENLCKKIGKAIKPAKLSTFHCLMVGEGFEATTMLIDELWTGYADEMRSELRVVVPSRDLIAFTGVAVGGSVDGTQVSPQQCLRVMCRSALDAKAEETVHGLSDYLFAWRNGAWVAEATLVEAYERPINDAV
jgi:hypothetical protein